MKRNIAYVVTLASSIASSALAKPPTKPLSGPLTPKERVMFEGATCEGFRTQLQDALAKAAASQPSTTSPTDLMQGIVDQLAAPPAGMSEADWRACRDLAIRDLHEFRARSIEVEAVVGLKQLAKQMQDTLAANGKLCPSTTPAPADLKLLAGGPYASQPEDWDATWSCVGRLSLPTQRFQYAITVKAKTFTIIAKGYSHGPGVLRTLTLTGKVASDGVKLSDIKRE